MAQAKMLTDAQKKALDDADGIFQAAAIKVKSTRVGNNNGNGNDYGHCLRCSCGGYVAPTGPDAHGSNCQREGCGHFFSSHDVF
jgi:hypothetical protein